MLISSSLFCWSLNLGSRWSGRGGTLCGSKGKESTSTTGLLTTAERLRFGPSVSWSGKVSDEIAFNSDSLWFSDNFEQVLSQFQGNIRIGYDQ